MINQPKQDTTTDHSRKGGLSCQECRRSKLKCDRVFPCQSCIRRGCPGICPNGTLTATKGNKVLMAHAQKLSEQVKTLTARIHELESTLVDRPDRHSDNDAREEVERLYGKGLEDAMSDAIGSLSLGSEGQARYHGETAGSEYFQDLLPTTEEDANAAKTRPKDTNLPYDLLHLVNAFPLGLEDTYTRNQYSPNIFLPYLPSREQALVLTELYYNYSAWMYDPIVKHDFLANVLEPIYRPGGLLNFHSHRISVFFILMAAGAIYDGDDEIRYSIATRYHSLARAAFALEPVLQEATLSSVQALFMMVRFIYNSDRSSNETRWILAGLCARVAQMIGLHRDSATWNLDPEECQRRRRMFWELYVYDGWTSIVNGRPPALMINHTDCHFPDDLEPLTKPTGEVEYGYHVWKSRYSASCLSISVQHIFSKRIPSYQALLDLDRRIRKFPVASHLQPSANECSSQPHEAWSKDPRHAMRQYGVLCLRESNLLYIHRSYFCTALRELPENPLKHKYGPSVLAIFRSSCRLLICLRSLYIVHAEPTSKVWFFWSGAYSACIVLGALVIESPQCTFSEEALKKIEDALPFYEAGSAPCRPASTLTMLQKLTARARDAYNNHLCGGLKSPGTETSDAPDELAILGGRTSIITTQSNASSPKSDSPSYVPTNSDEDSPPSWSGSNDPALMDYYDDFGKPRLEFAIHDFHMTDASIVNGTPIPMSPTQVIALESPIQQHYMIGSPDSITHQAQQHPSPDYMQQAYTNTVQPHQEYVQHIPHSESSLRQTLHPLPYHNPQPAYNLSMIQQTQPLTHMGFSTNFPAAGQDPTQDDVWRKFIREFGLDGQYMGP